MIRTYKYRLYPTKAQARALDFLLWQGRTRGRHQYELNELREQTASLVAYCDMQISKLGGESKS